MAPKKVTTVEDSNNAPVVPEVPEKTIKKRVTKKKTGVRTPSSYVLFSMEYRKTISNEFPELSLGEISKKCGEKWSSFSEDEKKEWKVKADNIKCEKNPPKEENRIKRKPSSYLAFPMEYRKIVKESNPKLSLGEISKECGKKWKELSAEEKESWKIKAAQ